MFREIVVGSLLYLENCTRPGNSYIGNVLSRHQIDPTNEEWNTMKRIMQHLSERGLSLIYRVESESMNV